MKLNEYLEKNRKEVIEWCGVDPDFVGKQIAKMVDGIGIITVSSLVKSPTMEDMETLAKDFSINDPSHKYFVEYDTGMGFLGSHVSWKNGEVIAE